MRLCTRIIAVTIAVGVLQGCSDQGPDDVLLSQLEAARDRWTRSRPHAYDYGLEHVCDCPADESGPVRITVRGDSVLSRTYLTGDSVPPGLEELFPSIDGLFALVESAIRGGAYEVRATYHLDSGVPLNVRIDYEVLEFGEELAYRTVAIPVPIAATLRATPGV